MNTADTRTRIQDVALRLFTEHGYEATSLREIAEEIGVTKAALYYHFKSKDEIVTSVVDDRIAMLRELNLWGQTLPPTNEGRAEFVRRYAAELSVGRHHDTMRFFERNQTALRDHKSGEELRSLMIETMDRLSGPDATPAARLRCGMAIFAVHASWFMLRDESLTQADREAASLEVALDLIRET